MPELGVEAGRQRGVTSHHQGRHGLGDAVTQHGWVTEDARRVPHRLPALDGGEGDDLGDVVPAVALGRVPDHLAAVARVEVHVDVGHLLAARVEEPLEQQPVADGIDVDDAQAVRDAAAAGRAASGPDPNALVARVADEVPDDEEVRGEAHLRNDAQLVVETFRDRGRHRLAVPPPGALVGEVTEVGVLRVEPCRQREVRQLGLAELDLDLGALGDPERVVARLRNLVEQQAHLGRRLQVVLLRLELEPLRVVDHRVGLHAQQRVVRHRVLAVRVVAVVGGQERRAQAAGDLDQLRIDLALLVEAVVLQLDEEVVAPEDVLQPRRESRGLLDVAPQQCLLHDATEAPGGGDDALVVTFEQLPVDTCLVPVALEVGVGRELHKVLVALVRLRQQRQVVPELVAGVALATRVVDAAAAHRPLETALAGHVGLDADDGRDPLRVAGLVEVEDAVHVPVVGDRDRRLPVGHRRRDDLVDACRAVEHREFSVEVKVAEAVAAPTRHWSSDIVHRGLWTRVTPL